MKKTFIIAAVFILAAAITWTACEEDEEPPKGQTNEIIFNEPSVDSISYRMAKIHISIEDTEDENITEVGLCYAKTKKPTIDNNKRALQGSISGKLEITGLQPNTTYHYRTYAKTENWATYGVDKTFATNPSGTPVLSTNSVVNVTHNSATCGGNITDKKGEDIKARGVCWNKNGNPTIQNNHTENGTGTGSFNSEITGLEKGTKYYVRAYATNKNGTAYGHEVTFTSIDYATVSTNEVTNISAATATGGGNVTNNGGGAVSAKGVCWSTSANPTLSDEYTEDGSGTGSFTSSLTGLQEGTTYYVRAYATNEAGTAYGQEVTFTTIDYATVTTNEVTNISAATATGGGNVTNNGGGTVSAKGVCWSTSSNPTLNDNYTTDGAGTGSFTSEIDGLELGVNYYVRAYATNEAGTAYGDEKTFTTILQIGGSYQGGIVAYILQPGDPGYIPGEVHGLIAAPSDQSTSAEWGCYGTEIGGTSTGLGTGMANTTAIVNGCSEAGIAARICNDLTLNGYNDWFLPSREELTKLYQNKDAIGGFSDDHYWSSSEYSSGSAWVQNFNAGAQYGGTKANSEYVRAVRVF